jgi:hypothetical protein
VQERSSSSTNVSGAVNFENTIETLLRDADTSFETPLTDLTGLPILEGDCLETYVDVNSPPTELIAGWKAQVRLRGAEISILRSTKIRIVIRCRCYDETMDSSVKKREKRQVT